MRDLFPGWVPPDEETLDRYWNEATFAVDTSVLLDLYRFSEEARRGLLEALRSFGERLWIPHQVGLEFHRNRLGVLLDQREAEDNLLRELEQIRQDLDAQLSQLLRGAGRRDLAPLREAIDDGFDSLKEKLKEAEKEHTKGLGESIRDDPIYEEVVDLCADRVGPPFSEERQLAVVEDAEERLRGKVPPGYLDDDKSEKTKYGDVILWHQLCDRASETSKPVVLVADDQKADWVWEVRGKTIGPRPELVAEMNDRSGVGFHLYTPTRLLEMWEKREVGRKVGPDILAEIEGSGRDRPAKGEDWLLTLADRLSGLRTYTSTSTRQNDEPWHAAHLVGPDQAELILELRGQADVPEVLAVSVLDPNGGPYGAPASPVVATPDSVVYRVQFPADFEGAGVLSPGEHTVAWIGRFRPDRPDGQIQPLAVDSFRIGG